MLLEKNLMFLTDKELVQGSEPQMQVLPSYVIATIPGLTNRPFLQLFSDHRIPRHNGIVGAIEYRLETATRQAELRRMEVAFRYRHQRIGTKMLTSLLAQFPWIIEINADLDYTNKSVFESTSDLTNTPAYKMFKSCGFANIYLTDTTRLSIQAKI